MWICGFYVLWAWHIKQVCFFFLNTCWIFSVRHSRYVDIISGSNFPAGSGNTLYSWFHKYFEGDKLLTVCIYCWVISSILLVYMLVPCCFCVFPRALLHNLKLVIVIILALLILLSYFFVCSRSSVFYMSFNFFFHFQEKYNWNFVVFNL